MTACWGHSRHPVCRRVIGLRLPAQKMIGDVMMSMRAEGYALTYDKTLGVKIVRRWVAE
jgi:hypothetical protein